jgi:hypothetical protein
MSKYFILVYISVLLFSCSSTKQSFEDYKGDSIAIGFGGGFSGIYNEYILHKNGDIFKKGINEGEVELKGRINKNMSLQIFRNAEILGYDNMSKNDPGNMNRYLIININGKNNKILWSANDNTEKELNLYFKILMNSIKKFNK